MTPTERALARGWVRHQPVGSGEAWWTDARGRRVAWFSWQSIAWHAESGILETEHAALAAALDAAGAP